MQISDYVFLLTDVLKLVAAFKVQINCFKFMYFFIFIICLTSKAVLNCVKAESIRFMDIAYKP